MSILRIHHCGLVTPGGKATLTFGRPAGLLEASWPPGKKNQPLFPSAWDPIPQDVLRAGKKAGLRRPPAASGGVYRGGVYRGVYRGCVGCFGKKRQKNKNCSRCPPALVPKKKLASGGLRRPPAASGGLRRPPVWSGGLAESATTESM